MRKSSNSRQIPVDVVGGSSYGRYNNVSSAKTYNMFLSKGGENDDRLWLINTAGYQRIYDLLPGGSGRGIFTSIRGNIIIAVVNNSVYSLDTNLNPTFIGNLNTVNGEVFIDENLSSQICIVDGVNAYIYNYAIHSPLTVQVIAGTLIPNFVDYHNTFFLFGNADTTNNGAFWYAYERATDTTIAPVAIPANGQFALQTKPDFAKAVVRLPGQGNNVLVLGTTVCEVWTQVGGLQGYVRNSTINVDYGCISVSTIARSDSFVAFLAVNEYSAPVIRVYTGQGSEPLSTMGIDYDLSSIKFPAQSTAMFVMQDGHLIYQLTFYNPKDNLTFIFDFSSGKFCHLSDQNYNYHPARNYVYFNNKTYFISLNNASIYQNSTDLTTYNENLPTVAQNAQINYTIPRVRITSTFRQEDSSQYRANNFTFTIEQGNDPLVTGLSLLNNQNFIITEDLFVPPDDVIYTEGGVPMITEDSGGPGGFGADGQPIPNNTIPYQPRVDLSISKDGGITWSNTVSENLHPLGYRQNIIQFTNMGLCNSLTLKLIFWGMSRFVVNNGVLDIAQ